MKPGQLPRWWATQPFLYALAAVVLIAGVAFVVVNRPHDDGLCRPGADVRPKAAPPVLSGSTGAAGIWLTDPDGQGSHHIAPALEGPPDFHRVLQWLPDGRIAHSMSTSGRHLAASPVIVGLDGKRTDVAGLPPGSDHAWSQDGRRVVFVDSTGLVTVAADGTDRRQVTTFAGTATDTARHPEWSPDGRSIVFIAYPVPPHPSSLERLEIVNADGTGPRVLIEGEGSNFLEPSWSPDGKEIAFPAIGGYNEHWIGVIHPDGSGYRRIARHCSGRDPQWSPDGRRIVFNDPYSLAVIDADGSHLKRIPNTWDASSAAWSKDGRTIAFLRY